ncbi:hypothetical protein DF186_18350, partial [Enterococcus hirae]
SGGTWFGALVRVPQRLVGEVDHASAVLRPLGTEPFEGVVIAGGDPCLPEGAQRRGGGWRHGRRFVGGALDQLDDGVPDAVEDRGVRT